MVRGNTKVMSEMLTEMVPGQEEASDYELLQVSTVGKDTLMSLRWRHVDIFLHFCVCSGAEQDLQIHAAENSGAHLLCFK